VFNSPEASKLSGLRGQTFGTAYLALGLVAYNTGQLSSARRFLLQALYFRPELWRDSLVVGNILKSITGRNILKRLRQVMR
jgi:hypothetical protein